MALVPDQCVGEGIRESEDRAAGQEYSGCKGGVPLSLGAVARLAAATPKE